MKSNAFNQKNKFSILDELRILGILFGFLLVYIFRSETLL